MKRLIMYSLILLLLMPIYLYSITLQEVYNSASPGIGYDRLLVLNSNSIYTGGLLISDGKVGIKGHGAIIDLNGGSIQVSGNANIEIDACVIMNGSDGFSALDNVSAYITHCTFYGNQVGVRFMSTGGLLEIVNSIFAFNSEYGLACDEESPLILNYIDAYQNAQGDYMKWCSG